jgi:hypothetical protein
MMTSKFIFILFNISFSFISFSQNKNIHSIPKIETDRPDQTECTSTVPKGYFQMEDGFTFSADKNRVNTIFIPSTLWKLGVNDKFELRMITEPLLSSLGDYSQVELPPIKFGFKTRLAEEKGALPNISFIGHLSIPFLSTENQKVENISPDFRFTFDNNLSDKFSLGYNLGMSWEDKNPTPDFNYTCALGYMINAKWKAYVELFGDKPQNEVFDLSTSGGIYYYPAPNIMFDITGAYGLFNTDLNYYTAVGISFLIPVKKN